MLSFVSRGPTNIEAEMFGKTPHSKTSPKVAIFPQHSLIVRIHSLASGEYTFDWNRMDSVGHQVEFRGLELNTSLRHNVLETPPCPPPFTMREKETSQKEVLVSPTGKRLSC